MKRYAEQQLIEWKNSPLRKPLLVMGARQVGKTWLMQEFGRKHYKNVAFVSFDDNERMQQAFQGGYDVERLLMVIQAESGVMPSPGTTLIIFDEVQECPRALTALKYFCENAREYHIMAAGSLLGLQIHQGSGFPVGKVDMLHLYPMTFCEYLEAVGQESLVPMLQSADKDMINLFADRLAEQLRQYYYVGGMPEGVSVFAQTKNYELVRQVHHNLLDGYRRDFSKHAPKELSPRIGMIWESIPQQLSRENKKFMCSGVAPGMRMRDIELALQWLIDAGLIHKVSRVTKAAFPPSAYRDSVFKLFFIDVGLLAAMSDLQSRTIVEGNKIFTEFKGALAEQYVQQQLRATRNRELFYWSSNQSDAEIDFAFSCGVSFVPVEVKAEIKLRAKSLLNFCRKQEVPLALRTSMAPFGVNKMPASDGAEFILVDIPLYAIEQAYSVCEDLMPQPAAE